MYKTQICPDEEKEKKDCKKGKLCQYVHAGEEIRQKKDPIGPELLDYFIGTFLMKFEEKKKKIYDYKLMLRREFTRCILCKIQMLQIYVFKCNIDYKSGHPFCHNCVKNYLK